MPEVIRTSYLGFVILVDSGGLTVLDRDGHPVESTYTMKAARKVVATLRRAERETSRAA